MHFETFLRLLEKEMWPKIPQKWPNFVFKAKKVPLNVLSGRVSIAQIKAETPNFHVVYSKPATWGVQRDYFSFKHKFWSFWATFPSLFSNALNWAKVVVPESRKTHKFQACKSINPGWSYAGFSKAWKLPKKWANFLPGFLFWAQ